PNPARPGQPVYITAYFQDLQASPANNSSDGSQGSDTDGKLTIKGCATCGFGSPQGFANLDRKGEYVQIGSTGQTSSSPDLGGQAAERTLRCTAVINAPDGSEAARMSLLHTEGWKYMGIWNAETTPGVYKTSIVASSGGNSETFADVLEIEVRI
ncbi:MAG: sulfurtransferase, partial [Methanosarcinales archaeon]|nr:sulfurtransferase [Methanosarcinales archaeon]